MSDTRNGEGAVNYVAFLSLIKTYRKMRGQQTHNYTLSTPKALLLSPANLLTLA